MHKKKLIHSVNIEDIQHVVEQELGRRPTEEELQLVKDRLGDYVGWYEAVLNIMNELKLKP
ncbi:MAG: hypothetical protein NG747_02270 [Candidatus Brocadia sp.]|nr:hypothetical protein [Candidatus Brocadia sp.]